MRQWLELMQRARTSGETREDRTGTGTWSLFGETLRFDLSEGFPAVTTKRLFFKQVAAELSCFVRGCQNLSQFHEVGCSIWDANATADYWHPSAPGDLGRIYGVQWRDWRSVGPDGKTMRTTDQLRALVNGLRADPWSRRHLMLSYQPGELDQVCLPACHVLCQTSVRERDRLDMTVYMRSVDLFLGLPFDVASYALLTHLLCFELGLRPGRLIFFLGDAHVYRNHEQAVDTVLSRTPLGPSLLHLEPEASVFRFYPEQAVLLNYRHHGAVPARMSV